MCEIIETKETNTAGQKINKLFCYCGTTTCKNFPLQKQLYPLPQDFKECYGNCYPELTPEEERLMQKSFYDRASKTETLFP